MIIVLAMRMLEVLREPRESSRFAQSAAKCEQAIELANRDVKLHDGQFADARREQIALEFYER
jgi:hypothetical protein